PDDADVLLLVRAVDGGGLAAVRFSPFLDLFVIGGHLGHDGLPCHFCRRPRSFAPFQASCRTNARALRHVPDVWRPAEDPGTKRDAAGLARRALAPPLPLRAHQTSSPGLRTGAFSIGPR